MPLPPLHRAARRGDLTVLASARALGLDPRAATGWTPLHDAAWGGHRAAVATLLTEGARIDATSLDGLSALMISAGRGHRGVVRHLLDAGADPDTRSRAGRSALESALQTLHVAVARDLVDAGATLTQGAVVLWVRALAAQEGRRCRLLSTPDPATGWTWAIDAPLTLSLDDERRMGPVLFSVDRVGPRVRGLALSQTVHVEARPAAFGPEDPGDGLPSGRWRVREGWSEAVQSVLHGDAPPDQPDSHGRLPTWLALQHPAPDALRALLELGAHADAIPLQGRMRGASLLLNAAHQGHAACVAALLDAGATIDLPSAAGWTPLMVAAAEGHTAIVRALLQAGADIGHRNAQGQTAMAVAQSRGNADAARALLIAQNRPKRTDALNPEG